MIRWVGTISIWEMEDMIRCYWYLMILISSRVSRMHGLDIPSIHLSIVVKVVKRVLIHLSIIYWRPLECQFLIIFSRSSWSKTSNCLKILTNRPLKWMKCFWSLKAIKNWRSEREESMDLIITWYPRECWISSKIRETKWRDKYLLKNIWTWLNRNQMKLDNLSRNRGFNLFITQLLSILILLKALNLRSNY